MYDALGFEIGSDSLASTRPDEFPPYPEYNPHSLYEFDSKPSGSGQIFMYEDDVSLVGEPLVLPGEEHYIMKSDTDDDWLIPLSNGLASQVDDVIVVGRRFTPTLGSFYNPYDYGDWDGHDTSQNEPPYVTEELPDCVSVQPVNIDEDFFVKALQYLTDHFRGAYNGIAGNQPINSSRYEYGVLIYELNGQIGHGDILTTNRDDRVPFTMSGVPDGARIIAWMHNHPNEQGVDDRIPSYHNGGDWDQHSLLLSSSLGRGITVDPNLLLVLYSNQDSRTRIYDNNDRNTRSASCPING